MTTKRAVASHKNEFARSGTSPRQERFTVAEFAHLLGFPVAALTAIIAKNRVVLRKPFCNISQLADRWGCSRAQMYINTAGKDSEERQSWRIPAAVVEQIANKAGRSASQRRPHDDFD